MKYILILLLFTGCFSNKYVTQDYRVEIKKGKAKVTAIGKPGPVLPDTVMFLKVIRRK